MRRMSGLCVLLAAVSLMGCKSKQSAEVTPVPNRADAYGRLATDDAGAVDGVEPITAPGGRSNSTSTTGYVTLPAVPPPGSTGAMSPMTTTSTGRYTAGSYTPAPSVPAGGGVPTVTFENPPAPTPQYVPATTPSVTPAPAPAMTSGGGTVHVVARGDTLYGIARKYYNDASRWRDIASANGITDEKKLAVGQRLTIP